MPVLKTAIIAAAGTLAAAAWLIPTVYYGLDEIANKCIGKAEYDKAITWSNAAIALNPNDGEFYVTRGLAYEWQDEYGQSLSNYNRAIQLEPGCAKGYYSRGFTYLFTDQVDKARQDAQKSIEIYPYCGTALNLLGRVDDKQCKYAEAVEAFKKQVEYEPKDVSAYSRLSTAYAKIGQLDLVAETQAKIRKLHLESKSSYVSDQQDLLNKLVALTSGIQADPRASSLYVQRAETFQKLEAYQQAIDDYTKALELDPKKDDLWFLRASAYAESKQYDKAIADYTESIRQNPDGAAAYVNRGLCYKDLKQYQKALADCEIAVAHNPDDLIAIDNLGSLYSTLGDHEQALAKFEGSFRFNDDADRYRNRGMEYLALGNYEKAYADFDSALSRSANSTSVKYQRAKALYKLGHFSSAVTDLNECLSYQPFDADTYALLGSCYTAQGKMKDAVSAFDHSIQIKPDCGPAHYGRAIMYEKLGLTDQAKKERSAASKLGCTAEA